MEDGGIRAIPEGLHESTIWALLNRDLDSLASFIVFADDRTRRAPRS